MVYWGDEQNNRLLELIESGDINPQPQYNRRKHLVQLSITLCHISTASKGRRDHHLRKRTPSHVFGRSSEITYSTELLKGLASELHKVCNFSLYDALSLIILFSSPLSCPLQLEEETTTTTTTTTLKCRLPRHLKTATKPDPTAAITVGMAAASLKPSLVKRYDLSIHFPYTSSPMGYFGDDKRRICVDFISITHRFDNYKAEVSGKTLRLYMKLPKRFIDPQRLNSELANIGSDRDTIVSAQTETASMIYNQYRDEDNILPPSCASSI